MQHRRDIRLTLEAELILAIGRAARVAGCTPSELVAAVLAERFLPALPRCPANPPPAEPGHVGALIGAAAGWIDLQQRLRAAGYVLRRDAGGDIGLHSWPQDRPLVPLAALGWTAEALALRFRAPFPGDVGAARAVRGGRAA